MTRQASFSRSYIVLFVRVLAIVFLLGLGSPTQAALVTFEYSESFGATAPDGPTPYGTAVFDDSVGPDKVKLTVGVSAGVGIADVSELYFNLDPALDPTDLSIIKTGGDGPAPNGFSFGADAFMADGDGEYDILIDLPPPGGDRFNAGETLVFEISGITGLVASDFDFLSAPGGGAGPYLSVMRFLSTGDGGGDSDWVGTPEPGSLLLALLALAAFSVAARRRRLK